MKVSEQYHPCKTCGHPIEQEPCPFCMPSSASFLSGGEDPLKAEKKVKIPSIHPPAVPGNPAVAVAAPDLSHSLPKHTIQHAPPKGDGAGHPPQDSDTPARVERIQQQESSPLGGGSAGDAPQSINPPNNATARPTEGIEGDIEQFPDLSPRILPGATTCPICKSIIDASYPCPFCEPNLPELLTPAEKNETLTRQLIRDGKANLLTIGLLLVESQDNAYWSMAGKWESWKDYLNSLGLASYSWMTRLVGMARLLRDGALTAQDIDEMGLGKAAMLLPHKLTPELIALARSAPPQDLREELRKATGKEPKDEKYIAVHCERCGHDFRWRVK